MPSAQKKRKYKPDYSAEAFMVEDTPYKPPPDPENRPAAQKAAGLVHKRRAVPRPKKKNLRDPFHILNDDDVYLIMTHLPARDTETLRRVSKLWKASSEFHCGKSALREHFPRSAAKVQGCKSREEANLAFRRCLYHHESLNAGLATRAMKCDGVHDWDLRNNCLVWSDTQGAVSTRCLRSTSNEPINNSETVDLEFRRFFPWPIKIEYVQIISKDEMLVTTSLDPPYSSLSHVSSQDSSITDTNPRRTEKLTKISSQGVVSWDIDLKASITRPAAAKDFVYFIQGSEYNSKTDNDDVLSFLKINLQDGSVVFDIPLWLSKLESTLKGNIVKDDRSLALSRNQDWASWKTHRSRFILSTATGQVMYEYSQPFYIRPAIPSSVHAGFWEVHQHASMLLTYNETTAAFSSTPLDLPWGYESSIRFDGDRSLFFRIRHDFSTSRSHDPFTSLGVSQAVPKEGQTTPKEFVRADLNAPITLPSRSTKHERRDLELDMPWDLKTEDFLGIINDYLIYQSPNDKVLVLIDFWPNW